MSYGEDFAIGLAAYYDKDLNKVRLEFDGRFFDQFTQEELKQIYIKCLSTFKFYPSIAELKELLQPKEDPKDQANEMSGAILQAVRDYGRYQPLKIKMLLGPIAWHAIESFGGWELLCNTPEDQMQTVRAQLRDMCKSALTIRSRASITDNLLEYQKHGMRKLGFEDITKYIDNKKEQQ